MNRPENESVGASDQQYISTARVAEALGVSVTTVKRWVDDGILPAYRTAGGHRKLQTADVLRLVRESRLPQANLAKLVPASNKPELSTSDLSQKLIEAMNRCDVELIRTLILGAYQSGLLIQQIADHLIAPAMSHVGHEWERGKIGVHVEHRLSQAVVSSLYELRAHLNVNSESHRPVALGGSPEHDFYAIPTLLAKLTLLDSGWDAINLGPHLPMTALERAIIDMKPKLVWLCVSHLENPDEFIRTYEGMFHVAERHGAAVAIGGRALSESIRRQMNYTTYGDGLTQLAAFAKSLHSRPQQPRRGRPPKSLSSQQDE